MTAVQIDGKAFAAKLREKIGLGSEAHFVATGDTFQILSDSGYAEKMGEVTEWIDDLDEDVDPLTFLDTGPED